jgi:hypothetical protein
MNQFDLLSSGCPPGRLDGSFCNPRSRKPRNSGAFFSAPDRIRICDLRFRRPREDFGGARLNSGFGSIPGLEFVRVRLDSVPSVALLLPSNRTSRRLLCMERSTLDPGARFSREARARLENHAN